MIGETGEFGGLRMESAKKISWAHCNSCSRPTKHTHLCGYEHREDDQDEEGGFYIYSRTYSTLQCCGCEEISFQIMYWHSDYEMDIEPDYYPPRISRVPPKWTRKLPTHLASLLREVYSALQSDSTTLAMMGARTLIDIYLTDNVGNFGSFSDRLKKLVSAGFLGSKDSETLDAALEAGNAAAHRGFTPDPSDLNHAMDIVESLLQRHVLTQSAASLKKATPPRPPKS